MILGPNETKKVVIEITFECCAMLDPLRAKICCAIVEKSIWNPICGIQAQTELSPLLSVDDIAISKEIGRGSYWFIMLVSCELIYLC